MRPRVLAVAMVAWAALGTIAQAQFPNLIYYKFDEASGVGGTTLNLASPGVGSILATVNGHALTAGVGQFNGGLTAAATAATTNFVDTGWATAFGSGSWTISFWMDVSAVPSSTLSYMFGDSSAGGFRSFTNGAAGAGNIMIRGGFTDSILPGAAVGGPHVVTWVYDASIPAILGYLDGVLGVTTPQTSVTVTGTAFRAAAYTTSNFAVGTILDEFRVYDYALTAGQVAATWNTTLFDQNILNVAPSSPSATNLICSVGNLTTTATEGWMLVSADTSQPLSSGPFFGITPDSLTWQLFLTSPLLDGNLLHFPVPSPTNRFPNAPFILPSGTTTALSGLTLDFLLIFVGPGFNYDGRSNIVRRSF